MGWGFRKSVKIGGMRINFSKRGIGASVGVKGARFGVNSRGVYLSSGIPSTGLYSTQYLGGRKRNFRRRATSSPASEPPSLETWRNTLIGIAIISSAIFPVLLIITIPIATYFVFAPSEKAKRKLKKAQKLFNNAQYKETITLLEEGRTLDEKNQSIQRLLGFSYHNVGEFERALPLLKDALEKSPGNSQIQLLLANAYHKTGQHEKSLAIAQSIPEEYEQYIKAIQLIGDCFFSQKQYDLAIEAFKRAPLGNRNLDDDLKEVHYNLATIYEAAGNTKSALKHLKKIYSQDIAFRDVATRVKLLEVKK